jgi:DNA-binding response OmpR family regulator
MRKTKETHSVILHQCRLRLSPAQARWLARLVARPGRLVADSELRSDQLTWKEIGTIREAIRAHGFAIYRVKHRGFVLLSE